MSRCDLGLAARSWFRFGPTTSEELQRHGVRADLEPSHPKMGFLVKEAAEQSGELLRRKRQGAPLLVNIIYSNLDV